MYFEDDVATAVRRISSNAFCGICKRNQCDDGGG